MNQSIAPRKKKDKNVILLLPRETNTNTSESGRETPLHLEEVDHLGVELRAFRQRVEDEVVNASDAVAVEEVRASRVEEEVAVPPEKPRSRSSHLQCSSAEQHHGNRQGT